MSLFAEIQQEIYNAYLEEGEVENAVSFGGDYITDENGDFVFAGDDAIFAGPFGYQESCKIYRSTNIEMWGDVMQSDGASINIPKADHPSRPIRTGVILTESGGVFDIEQLSVSDKYTWRTFCVEHSDGS